MADVTETTTVETQEVTTLPEPESGTFDAEYVKKLRTESADYRTKLREAEKQLKRLAEFEDAEKKRQEAELSEKDKLEKRLADLESTNSQLSERYASARLRHAVEIAAVTMQFADPEDAYNLADMSGAEIAEDGKITGVKEALEALAKAKPYLIKSGNGKPPGTPQGKPPARQQLPQTNEPHKPLVRL
jgi:hypothetical protein